MANIRVEVKSKKLANVRPYQDKHYGDQEAALHLGGDFPLKIVLNSEQGKEVEPGMYELDPSTFTTNKFGRLTVERVKLGDRLK